MIIETKDDVRESDLVNATLWKYLSKITTKDVLEFREEFAGRNSDAGREGRRLSAVRRATERRLAYEIALGIWLGGMALGLTSFVLWFFALSAMVGALKLG
ncbi:hypothetical protein [Pseudomonas aeruginosa]|uniref:hypothetical protein n=1 Tax=Pseudomonas aeruginosa TaxID=287 RepID=UPI0018DF02B3|nr:hypothetical protein [Pseudomonas aeruginosa]